MAVPWFLATISILLADLLLFASLYLLAREVYLCIHACVHVERFLARLRVSFSSGKKEREREMEVAKEHNGSARLLGGDLTTGLATDSPFPLNAARTPSVQVAPLCGTLKEHNVHSPGTRQWPLRDWLISRFFEG